MLLNQRLKEQHLAISLADRASKLATGKKAEMAKLQIGNLEAEKVILLQAVASLEVAIRNHRKEVDLRTSIVQKLTILQVEKETLLEEASIKLKQMLETRRSEYDILSSQSKLFSTSKVQLRQEILAVESKLDRLNGEKTRTLTWKHQQIDSDIWQDGVMQRMALNDLKKFLEIELEKINEKYEYLLEDERHEKKVYESAKLRIEQVVDEIQQLSHLISEIQVSVAVSSKLSVAEELKEKVRLKQEEDEAAIKRHHKLALEITLKKQGFNSRAERIRHLTVVQRSYEEAQWCAIDEILNPHLYQHINILEREHMSHDEAYKTTLSLEDIKRICALPDALNEAMPFLRSSTEIHAHYLICKFTYERDEDMRKEEDSKIQLSDIEFQEWEKRRQETNAIRFKINKNDEENEWANYDYILQRDLWKGNPRDKLPNIR